MSQTISSIMNPQNLPNKNQYAQYGDLKLSSARMNWKMPTDMQYYLTDKMQQTTANNDNTKGAGIYGETLYSYQLGNQDTYPQKFNEINDVERITGSLHIPYITPSPCIYPVYDKVMGYAAYGKSDDKYMNYYPSTIERVSQALKNKKNMK